MEQTGLGLVDRAAFDQPATRAEAGAGLVLGDSMGEMPAWYAMADVVIMGGSLLAFGGQNLIEACACGAPVVLGPSTYNFELPATQALSVGAARQVQDADAAVAAALALLADGAGLGQMQQAAPPAIAERPPIPSLPSRPGWRTTEQRRVLLLLFAQGLGLGGVGLGYLGARRQQR